MKTIIPIVLFLVIAGALFYFFDLKNKEQLNVPQQQTQITSQTNNASSNQMTNKANNNTQMKKEILKEGTGESAKIGDKITVNYAGWLQDGTKFDSSIGKAPFSFNIGSGVIEGWSQGLLGAKAGEKLKLTIPPELGYGSQGAGSVIPPNATLIFEIEVLKIGQ
jgi:peptidylprolyl isomerase/FKBP-type peptidyl-prolyl cis-trans isomerase FkpA